MSVIGPNEPLPSLSTSPSPCFAPTAALVLPHRIPQLAAASHHFVSAAIECFGWPSSQDAARSDQL
ncbi:hypothetical protein AKJ16_DCAP06123 [Drosera capensis]